MGQASSQCMQHIEMNDTIQPPLKLFADPGCNGPELDVPIGLQPDLDTSPTVKRNQASSYILPPNLSANICQYPWNERTRGTCRIINFRNGVVVPDLGQDFINSGSIAPGNDDIDAVNVTADIPWGEYISQCCRGVAGERQKFCQQFSGPTAPACFNTMAKYCSQNVFSPVCQQWCANNPGACASIMDTVCNNPTGLTDKRCQSWCKQTGKCDSGMTTYCQQNPGDPICTCLTSPVKKYNPSCVDSSCITSGYITSSMRTKPCPNIVDCSTQLALQAGGRLSTRNIAVEQNCGQQSSTGTDTGGSSTKTSSNRQKLIWLLVLMIIALGGLGAGAVMILR